MERLIFKAEDFANAGMFSHKKYVVEPVGTHQAEKAQQLFDAWYKANIEDAPTVYFPTEEDEWMIGEDVNLDYPFTHTAKLVDIHELK